MTMIPWIAIPHEDPVCGMTVDEKSSTFRTGYAGKTYYFCSAKCLSDFTRNPGKFAK